MNKQKKVNKIVAEGLEIVVDEAESVVKSALRSGAKALGGNVRGAIQKALSKRGEVVMVRVNEHTLARLDELIEAGLVNSRSEASAFLIGEGIIARKELFDSISERIGKIREVRQELHDLIDDSPNPEAEEHSTEQWEEASEPTVAVGARQFARGSTNTATGSSSPNDQRSNVKNPNNPASRAASNNRSNQMNPNNPSHRASRGNRR